MRGHVPPRLPGWLRSRVPDDLLGHLEEGFARLMGDGTGRHTASVWYWTELVRFLVRTPGLPPRSRIPCTGGLDMLRQDLKLALRSLIRRPALSFVIVATLALAIGANTTIFSLVNSLFFGSVQVAEPEELVEIYGSSERDANVGGFNGFLPISYPNFEDLRERASTLEDIYAYTLWPVSIELGDQPERSQAMFVSADYFDILGPTPSLQRAVLPVPGGERFRPGFPDIGFSDRTPNRSRLSAAVSHYTRASGAGSSESRSTSLSRRSVGEPPGQGPSSHAGATPCARGR